MLCGSDGNISGDAMADKLSETISPKSGNCNSDLEVRISEIGSTIANCLSQILSQVPDSPHGPQSLARALGLDKVFTSRLLKALRAQDPVAVIHLLPGPDPLRRFIRAAGKLGVSPTSIESASTVVTDFETLIRQVAGDRSSLDAMISAWLPEARRDFELRRKQSAFKAMSELIGASVRTNLATVILHPSANGETIDIVWLIGMLGLQRLRPGVTVKMQTRRFVQDETPRLPTNLDGIQIQSMADACLGRFCEPSIPEIDILQSGESIHYLLGSGAFGPGSAVDLVLCEVNLEEMARFVPAELKRKGNVFAGIATPSRSLLFDVLVHNDVYPATEPQLIIYDTAINGVADINDPARDIDRMNLSESIQSLGRGAAQWRDTSVPNYVELLRYVFDQLKWDAESFRGYRCAIDYPVYGSQVAMAFTPPPPPHDKS
jgi:hypothetical protein